jgi:hypothetical protein
VGFEIADWKPERTLQIGLTVGGEEIPSSTPYLVLTDILRPDAWRKSLEWAGVTRIVLDRLSESRGEPRSARNGCPGREFVRATHEVRPPLPKVVPCVSEDGRFELPSTQPPESLSMTDAPDVEQASNAFGSW